MQTITWTENLCFFVIHAHVCLFVQILHMFRLSFKLWVVDFAWLVVYKRFISKLFKGFSLRLSHIRTFQKPWGRFVPWCVSFPLLNDISLLILQRAPICFHFCFIFCTIFPLLQHNYCISWVLKQGVRVRNFCVLLRTLWPSIYL